MRRAWGGSGLEAVWPYRGERGGWWQEMRSEGSRASTDSCVVQELVNYGPRAKSDRPLVFTNRVVLERSRLICLRVVDGRCRAAVEEFGSCCRDNMACKV